MGTNSPGERLRRLETRVDQLESFLGIVSPAAPREEVAALEEVAAPTPIPVQIVPEVIAKPPAPIPVSRPVPRVEPVIAREQLPPPAPPKIIAPPPPAYVPPPAPPTAPRE